MDPTPPPSANPGMARTELEVPFLKILITALSVTDRPDLIEYRRKISGPSKGNWAVSWWIKDIYEIPGRTRYSLELLDKFIFPSKMDQFAIIDRF